MFITRNSLPNSPMSCGIAELLNIPAFVGHYYGPAASRAPQGSGYCHLKIPNTRVTSQNCFSAAAFRHALASSRSPGPGGRPAAVAPLSAKRGVGGDDSEEAGP